MYRLKHAFVEGQNIMGLMLMPFTIFIEIKRYDMMNAFVYLIEFTAKIYFADWYTTFVQKVLHLLHKVLCCKEDAEKCHRNGMNYI